MNHVNKTLYIPLYGKAFVSKKGVILRDQKAEQIWAQEKFLLKGKAKSKWLAYYMGMRSAVFDKWVKEKIVKTPDCVVLHLGCGLDSRIERVRVTKTPWFDIDFQAVITERKRYYHETESYRMISADIKEGTFIKILPKEKKAVVLLEGVSMYLTNEELKQLFVRLQAHGLQLSVLLDCYTPFATKMSKIKNPIRSVGVSNVYGIEHFSVLEEDTGLTFVKEHAITPQYLIDELSGFEKRIFRSLYAGNMSKKLYRLYEYQTR